MWADLIILVIAVFITVVSVTQTGEYRGRLIGSIGV